MKSLLLDTNTWDILLDANGNIAICSEPYAIAQDVSTACRTFAEDCYYNTTLGIPYFKNVLGKAANTSYLRQQYIAAALSVPGVVSAQCFFAGVVNRRLTGQIQFTTDTGVPQSVGF